MIEVIEQRKPESAPLAARELVHGSLYKVVRPATCRGDLVLAVRAGSRGGEPSTAILVLTARDPFGKRVPFLSADNLDSWLFEPAPDGTQVLIK